MKYHLTALLLILALVIIVLLYPSEDRNGSQGVNALSLGFVILSGYLSGEILSRFYLPRITGYLLAGMFFGPYVWKIVAQETVQDFLLIDQIALALIALTAGGELRIDVLKKRWQGIGAIILSQTVILFLLGTIATYGLLKWFSLFQTLSPTALWSIALVTGVIAIAQSPASTIAIVTETKAAGIGTELVLGIAVLKDVVVIALFTCLLMFLGTFEQGMESLQVHFLFDLGKEILYSVGGGIVAGMIVSFYLAKIRVDPILFLLAFCYLVSVSAQSLHLDALLICVTAGIWVTNASQQGSDLIETLENGSLIIYVIFFCVAGASLDITALTTMWGLALSLVALRMVLLAVATWIGSKIARQPIPSLSTYWMVFLPQAGVSLGLVALLQKEAFSWSAYVQTLVIACIAVNQILGPILMKYALYQAGEINQQVSAQ